MNDRSSLEERLQNSGREAGYPATPDIAGAVHLKLAVPPLRPRLIRLAMVALLVVAATVLAVPSVRAQVIEFLRIGVVRICSGTPAPTRSAPAPTASPPQAGTERPQPTATVLPQMPEHSISVEGLAGETTLVEARRRFPYPILLPQAPEDLGEPDRVFLQEHDELLILAWLDPADPTRARLSLHEIVSGSIMVEKYQPQVLEATTVNGHAAAWVKGPYLVVLSNGDHNFRRMVAGNTLIWEADGITYRLETTLSLAEARQVAESLR